LEIQNLLPMLLLLGVGKKAVEILRKIRIVVAGSVIIVRGQDTPLSNVSKS